MNNDVVLNKRAAAAAGPAINQRNPFEPVLDKIEVLSPFHRMALGQMDLRQQAFFFQETGEEGWARVRYERDTMKFVVEATPRLLSSDIETQAFIILHEIEHVLRGHLAKPKMCTPRRWNIAGDIVINDDLNDEFVLTGKLKMDPELWNKLCSHAAFKIDSSLVTIDEVYRELPADPEELDKQCQGGGGAGIPTTDDLQGTHGDDAADQEEIDEAIEEIARELRKGQGYGTVAARFKDLMAPPHKAKVDWKALLREAFGRIKPTPKPDYNKINPKKWMTYKGIAPGKKMPQEPTIFVGIDTSGSCMGAIPFFLQELNQCIKMVEVPIDGCFIDTQMYRFDKVDSVDEKLKNNVRGGGGTYFAEMYKHLKQADPTYDLVIIMTDTWVEPPEHPLGKRTIVLNISGSDANWKFCEMYNVEIGETEW